MLQPAATIPCPCCSLVPQPGRKYAAMLVVKTVSQGMIDERQAGASNLSILRTPDALGRLHNQPACFEIESVLALLRVTIAVGHAPVIMEVVSAIASVRIDDLVDEYVQQFFETRPHTSVARDVVERGEGFHQAEMPVVGFPSE